MALTFLKVESKKQIDQFHKLPFAIYKNYPNWIPPFRFEIENIFDPEKNDFFAHGECERYLVLTNGEIAGRFAVMNNRNKDLIYKPPMGGMGFIEMYDDQEIADGIVNFAKEWHKKRGYGAFRGPINFGENDNYWGLLVKNYDEPPIYGMYYHPPYYKKLLEATGAEKLDDHWSYKRHFDQPLP
ncbi:MAG: GNAT family N-acetyltransferase, partial [Balneolaceae bacterium]